MKNAKYLQWAIMFILFALPSYALRFKIAGIPITMLEVMILATFATWFLGSYKQVIENIKTRRSSGTGLSRYPFDIEIVLLLIISFVSVGVAGFSNEAFGIWKAYFFEPLLFYVLLFNVFASPSRNLREGWASVFAKIIWPLTVATFLISVFAIYQKITGNLISNPFWAAVETRRVVSVFAYPNALGLYLAPLVLLMTGKLFSMLPRPAGEGRGEGKGLWFKIIFLAITIILSLLSIYFAHSEGAIVGIAAGVIMFGLLAGRRMSVVTLGVLGIVAIIFFANANLHDKIIEKGTLGDFSGEVRKQQWRETWAMLTESPQRFILGAGLANYQGAVKPYHQEGIFFNQDKDPDFYRKLVIFNNEYKEKYWRPVEVYLYPHNIFLNFWSELGLAGALLIVWIIIKFYYLGAKLIKNYELQITNNGIYNKYIVVSLLSAMTAIVIHGAVDVPYFKNDLAVMFWMIIALMGMGQLMINKENKN